MSEAIRNEMEQMKKKLQSELKSEITKVQQSDRETKEQIETFEQKIEKIETLLEKQGQSPQKPTPQVFTGVQREEMQTLINELQETLED